MKFKTVDSTCVACGRTWRTRVESAVTKTIRFSVRPEGCPNCRELRRLLRTAGPTCTRKGA